jgi:2-phosphosulfolactate phosphatase
MKFHYTDLETCHEATGIVIVIDVLRAFTTSAYAFSRGARKILLVSNVEEAMALRSQIPNSRVMGEVEGVRPQGFDFGNSPTFINAAELAGTTIIHRTSAGTQGVVRSRAADVLLGASFVVAGATSRYVQNLNPHEVSFVITGKFYNGGDEDLACAEYLEQLLRGNQPAIQPFIKRVLEYVDAFPDLDPAQREFPLTDLDHAARIDRFEFAMPVTREGGAFIMRCVRV